VPRSLQFALNGGWLCHIASGHSKTLPGIVLAAKIAPPRPSFAVGRAEVAPVRSQSSHIGFRLSGQQRFEIGLVMGPAFYLDYTMTETNIAAAVRNGTREQDIRESEPPVVSMGTAFQSRP
jgi:hypothetical protein